MFSEGQVSVSMPIAIKLALTLALLIIIVILSVTPERPQSGDSVFLWLVSATPAPLQKILHIVAYAILAILWMWTFEKIDSILLRVALAFAITVAIGSFLEWYQTLIPGRFGTLMDAILNAFGALIGLLFGVLLL